MMDERPHYTLSIQSGRHVATQKLVLPKPQQPPAQTPVTPADDIREGVPGWIAAAKRALGDSAPTDE